MNISELARILKISPNELREMLPQLGFHIGQKAIKIDNRTAQKIIKNWNSLQRKYQKIKTEENEQSSGIENDQIIEINKISIPNYITVKEFANLSRVPVNKILAELMKNGIFTSINEKIDYETAAVIGGDMNLDVRLNDGQEETNETEQNKLSSILEKEDKDKLVVRPPVIVVMGHVDHGKTRLLDAIRTTDVIAGEAGGITQHIGAYQVTRRKRLISFIDTPGHEAFTAMRSRGAKVADVAILVVAADDGVKPQTIEAFKIIEAAKTPFIVAINKIDKPEADINKTKQELSTRLNITPEDWGGKTICAPISAKEGQGIIELLDMILLVADMNEENMMANPNAPAAGTVIESNIDKGAGPVATILIQNGTLRVGNQLVFKGKIYGKVRNLKDYKGEDIDSAGPSMPVRILGLKILPEVGDILEVGEGEKIKSKRIQPKRSGESSQGNSKNIDESIPTVNLIIKSDVLGSAEAIEESLEKINTEKIRVKIIHKGLGNITEGDVLKAESSDAIIAGFNVKTTPQIEDLIREKNVDIKIFNIIYDLIEYTKEEMAKLVVPEFEKEIIGKLKVMAVFRTETRSQIIGGKVIEGKIEANSTIEVLKDDEIEAEGKIIKLQAGKQDVNEVETDFECGIQYEGKPIIEEGDILQFYKMKEIQ